MRKLFELAFWLLAAATVAKICGVSRKNNL